MRPHRLQFPGAMYHATSRGIRRQPIFEDSDDRTRFLALLRDVVQARRWLLHAY